MKRVYVDVHHAAKVCEAKLDNNVKVATVQRNMSIRQWGAADYIKSQGYFLKIEGADGPEFGNWNLGR